MPLIRYALVAAAASMLAGAATAQPASSGSTDNMPSAANPPPDQMGAPASADTQAPPTAQTAVGTETSAVVNGQTVQVIASPPVPDTPENRAKFGQPLSRAGKRTKPIGN